MHAAQRLTVCLVLLAVGVFSGQAFAASVVNVGTCQGGVIYPTIQQAVNAVSSGGTVNVCPGNYFEQVTISQSVILKGVANAVDDAVVILPPKTGSVQNAVDLDNTNAIAAQIVVQNASGVRIADLTVDGTGNAVGGCTPVLEGILFQNASGDVANVAVRNQTLGSGLGGCQSGYGIFVQTSSGLSSNVTVQNSSVHNYNKNGITGRDAGTKLTVTGTYVQGSGVVASGLAAQNGVEIAFGASGSVSTSIVIDNIYGDTTIADSADILLFDAAENASITVSSNTVGNSQLPIAIVTDTAGLGDGVAVTSNKIFGTSSADAVDVCTNNNRVANNTIINSAQSAIHLDASCGGGTTGNNNTVTGNMITESACAGILLDQGTSGNTVTPDTFYTVPFTLTGSTNSCTIPPGPALAASSLIGTGHRLSPAK